MFYPWILFNRINIKKLKSSLWPGPISLTPLPILYFRRKEQPTASNDAAVAKLQKEIEAHKIIIKEMEAHHLYEINAMRALMPKMRQSDHLEKNLAVSSV